MCATHPFAFNVALVNCVHAMIQHPDQVTSVGLNFPALLVMGAAMLLAGCERPLPTLASTPHVPEVVGRVGVNMLGGSRAVAVNPSTGDVYIASSHYITLLRGSQNLGEIELKGAEIRSIAVDETNGLLYVVNELADSVTVLRGTNVLGVVPTVGKNPFAVAIEPQSRFAYIVSGYKSRPLGEVEGNVLVISGTQVIDNLNLGRLLLAHVVADPKTGLVYVGDISGGIVVLKGLREVARHKIETLDSLEVNPKTGEVYALAHQKLYRFKDSRLIDSMALLPNMGNVGQVRANPATGVVYIPHTGYVSGEGRVLAVQNMRIIEDIRVNGLATVGVDPLTGNVYAASFLGDADLDTVTVINGTKVLATIKVGWFPNQIGVDSTNGWVYVVSDGNGTVTILGYPSDLRETPVPSRTPTPNPISPEPSRVYP